MTTSREIARRISADGVHWETADVEEGSGGGSEAFTGAVLIDPAPDALTGRTFAPLSLYEPTVVWDYDGDQIFSVEITGYLPNTHLVFASDDDLSANPFGYTDSNGDLTLTKTNVGFDPGNGPDFNAHIHVAFGLFGDVPTIRALSVGTPYAATENYRLGVVAVYVPVGGNEGIGQALVSRGTAIFGPTNQFEIPLTVIAVDGQAAHLFRVLAADGSTELFGIGPDGTPAFHGAGVPQIPASPTPQDIADALVALGLATQAS